MVKDDSKLNIVLETLPSETFSIIGHLIAGIILTLLILPFKSFIILIVIIPALLSVRGNVSGPFYARTSRDLMLGDFNKQTWTENILATYVLSLICSFLIGIFSLFLNVILIKCGTISNFQLIFTPMLSVSISLSISVICSTLLNYITFHRGLNPNNVVPPIMTTLDDFLTIISFYGSLLILKVA
ncbi:MAG: magnesium transporter [Promethearchaeota archaeon]